MLARLPLGVSPHAIMSRSGASAKALGRVSNDCGMRCDDVGPGLSENVIWRLRWASLSEFSGLKVTVAEFWIGASSKAIWATRHWCVPAAMTSPWMLESYTFRKQPKYCHTPPTSLGPTVIVWLLNPDGGP